MPEEKVSMRKVKEILRLRFGLGLQQNQIARSCSIGQATVHRYLRKAAAAGLTWPVPEDLDDRRLEELLFPAAVGRPSQLTRPMPDFDEVRRQLQTVGLVNSSWRRWLRGNPNLHWNSTTRAARLHAWVEDVGRGRGSALRSILFTLVTVAHGAQPEVSGRAPFVPVMETADLRDRYDPSKLWRLHSPRFRRVLTQ